MKKIALAAIASALLIGTCLNAQDLVPIARQGSFTIYAILNDAPQEGFTSHRIVLVNEFGTVNGVGHVNIANSHQVWSSLDSSPEKSAFLPTANPIYGEGWADLDTHLLFDRMALQSVTNPITEEIEMSTENGFDRLPTTAVAQTGIGATKATGFSFKDEFASREIDFAQVVARPDSPATISFGFNEFDFSIEVDIEDPAEAFCSTSNAQFCLDFASDPVSRGAILGGRWEWLGSGGLKGGYLDFPARGVVVVPLPNTQDSIVVGGDGNGVRGVVHHLDNFEVTLDADRVHMSGMLRVGKSASGSSGSGFSFSLVPNTDPTTVADGNGWVERPTDIFVGGAFIELEEGTVSGISIGFDERQSTPAAPELLEHWYGPDARDIVGMSIRVDGELLCQASLPTLNGAVDDPNSLQTGPNDSGIDALGWAQLTIEMPANYDDSTTGDDITVTWKGQEVEFVGAACSVPEPSQGLLAFTALLGSALVRRNFRGLCR